MKQKQVSFVYGWTNQFMIDQFLGYSLKSVFPILQWRIRGLIITVLFNALVLILFAPVLIWAGDLSNGVVFILNGLVYLFSLYFLKDREYERAVSFFVIVNFFSLSFHTVFSGGFTESQVSWFLLANICVFYFLGPSRGIAGVIYTVGFLFALVALEGIGFDFESNELLSGDQDAKLGVSLFSIGILVFVLIYYNQKEIMEMQVLLNHQNERMSKIESIGEIGSLSVSLKNKDKVRFSSSLKRLLDQKSLEIFSENDFDDLEEVESLSDFIDHFLPAKEKEKFLENYSKAQSNSLFDPLELKALENNSNLKYVKISGEVDELNDELVLVMKNITEHFEAKKNLEDYKNALDQSALVSIANRSGRIIYANQKFLEVSKYEESELIGKDHKIISSGEHEPDFWRGLWTTISNGKVWRGIVKNQAKDNSFFWVDTTIVPFLDENGRPDYYVAIRFDVTEQKNSETEILRKNKELEQFSYVLSHDLKSPLRAIKTLIHFIKDDMEDANLELPKEVENNFHLIDDRVMRMEALIMSVLDYAQVGAVKEKEWVRFNDVIEEVIAMIDIPKNFKMKVSQDLPEIFMNKVELKQVVQNIMTNAVKYNNNEEPHLMIYPGLKKKNYLIHFKDNGKGIDPQYHDKIFNLFETLKQKDSYESTGIGLPIVKKVVEQTGGEITVRSSLGEGSDFILSFPISICKM